MGYINKQGQVIIPIVYYALVSFSEGLYRAKIDVDGYWGYIDRNGDVIIPFVYCWAWDFSEGLAGVRQSGKWGFIDKKRTVVIPLGYDDIY